MNHYERLGVPMHATQQEIKKAYIKQIKKYHPDNYKGPLDALSISKAINEAYTILSDPAKRKKYDSTLKSSTEKDIRRKAAEESARRKAAEESARRKAAEESARRKAAEEPARKKADKEDKAASRKRFLERKLALSKVADKEKSILDKIKHNYINDINIFEDICVKESPLDFLIHRVVFWAEFTFPKYSALYSYYLPNFEFIKKIFKDELLKSFSLLVTLPKYYFLTEKNKEFQSEKFKYIASNPEAVNAILSFFAEMKLEIIKKFYGQEEAFLSWSSIVFPDGSVEYTITPPWERDGKDKDEDR